MSLRHSRDTDLKQMWTFAFLFWSKNHMKYAVFISFFICTCQTRAEGGPGIWFLENKSLIKQLAVSFSAGFLFNGM